MMMVESLSIAWKMMRKKNDPKRKGQNILIARLGYRLFAWKLAEPLFAGRKTKKMPKVRNIRRRRSGK